MSLPKIEIPDITADEKRAVRAARSPVGRVNTKPMPWNEEIERIQIVARMRGHSTREIIEGLQEVRTNDWESLRAAAAPLLKRVS